MENWPTAHFKQHEICEKLRQSTYMRATVRKVLNWSKFGYKHLRNGNKYPFPHLAPIDLLFKIHTHVDLQSTARYTDTVM